MTRSAVVILVALFALIASACAQAADCNGRQSVGYRVLPLPSGRKVAVWYPAAAAEQAFAYTRAGGDLKGSIARDAPPAACPRVPLVLFSHGLGGCGLQSTFLTEELARRGYVVAAPDHATRPRAASTARRCGCRTCAPSSRCSSPRAGPTRPRSAGCTTCARRSRR